MVARLQTVSLVFGFQDGAIVDQERQRPAQPTGVPLSCEDVHNLVQLRSVKAGFLEMRPIRGDDELKSLTHS